jgi:tetratricopeptide (TPR) repeat protein
MRRAARWLLLLLILDVSPVSAGSSADEHMLAGAQFFQAGSFNEALVEFRVAERTGDDGGAIWYIAATLVKLKRPEDALAEFARAEAKAAAERDALFDYYHALACYDARLFLCADRLLAVIGEGAGPRIGGQARRIRAELAPIGARAPSIATIDWYHARGRVARTASRLALAVAYYDEAGRLASLRPDGYRRREALSQLEALRAPAVSEGRSR